MWRLRSKIALEKQPTVLSSDDQVHSQLRGIDAATTLPDALAESASLGKLAGSTRRATGSHGELSAGSHGVPADKGDKRLAAMGDLRLAAMG